MAIACNLSACAMFAQPVSTIVTFIAPLSLPAAKDRRNKRDQQLSRTRATGKPKTHFIYFRALLLSLVLLPALALVSNTRLGDL